ncbi:MAG: hypothetical protein EXS63_09580 [Candidatus Omnitrophica bacterium]|nr:hypothetical protein [Candidatus Omnitrophota bacterium]
MSKEVRIAIVSSEIAMSQSLEKVMGHQFQQMGEMELKLRVFTHIPSVEDAIVHYSPRIVIVCIGKNDRDDKLHFLAQLSRVSARVPVVVCAQDVESDLMLACVKRGVSDFFKYPLEEVEIRETLGRLLEKSFLINREQKLGAIFTFFSYKGGVGTTLLACNTAVAIARITGKPVLLWDMVLQNGDVPFFLDYEPKMTLKELIQDMDAIDDPYLRSALPPQESGISILAAPRSPEEADSITHDQIQQMYGVLRKHYEYIVVDAGHAFTDPVISIMDASHYIVFPTDLHLPVLKNTLRCIGVFEKFGYVEEKFKIVINRYNSKYEEVDLAKAEKILPYPIAYTFANDYMAASRSLNTGIPLVDLEKKSPLTKQFMAFARLLMDGFDTKSSPKGSFLSGLFGSKQK